MKKIIGYFVVLIFLAASSFAEARDFYPKIFADINKEAKKSVVMILGGANLDSAQPYITSHGAGFLVGKNLVLTAYHVVSNTPEIIVKTLDGDFFSVEAVVGNPAIDVALVKIKNDINMPPLKLGDSSKLEEGDIVMAIGHPFGLGWTLSIGVISAFREEGKGLRGAAIQIDASTNPGNSGGPLLNLEGEAIGVIVAKRPEGISLAVPINFVKELLKALEKNNEQAPAEQNVSK